jgi:hypothetical protein
VIRALVLGGAAVLAAAIVLVKLLALPSDAVAPVPGSATSGTTAPLVRATAVTSRIIVVPSQPIAPGLPPWVTTLPTLRQPPPPEGTAVPVVPDEVKSAR